MHPVIHDGLNKARIADFHRWAEQDRLARASIQGPPHVQETWQGPGGRPRATSSSAAC